VECPNGLYWRGAYVNKLKLFEREFGTYEAMQIHDSVISIGQQELYDREEAQRQISTERCPKIERIRAVSVEAFAEHISSQHADHVLYKVKRTKTQ
jgi:DNA-binding transcriptional regulator YdaS (Cro superfamily)